MIHEVHSPNDALSAMAAVAIVYLTEGMELNKDNMEKTCKTRNRDTSQTLAVII
jgi:hypothetical protein